MKNSSPDFPPFTKRQLDLLEEIKVENSKLSTPSSLYPEVIKIRKRIDELSIKALRFAFKNYPAESRRPGFFLEVPSSGGRLLLNGEYKISPGFGDFHPDLLPWAEDHFIEWIRMHRSGILRYDSRDVLRETGIVGIETGMKPPIKLEDIERRELIKQRVLEIRGVRKEENEDDDSDLIPAVNLASPIEHKSPQGQTPPYTLDELQNELQNRTKVTPAMLKKARTKQERKRTRKNFATWDIVIDNLVEEKLLPDKITPQAFRKWLKKHFHDYPWNKV